MNDNIQTNTTGRLKRVILHDLEHGKQGKSRKSDENDEYILDKQQQEKPVVKF